MCVRESPVHVLLNFGCSVQVAHRRGPSLPCASDLAVFGLVGGWVGVWLGCFWGLSRCSAGLFVAL